jgi:hypothetical protein
MQKPATPAAPNRNYYVNTYSLVTLFVFIYLAATVGSFVGNMTANLLRKEEAPARCECTHIYMGEATVRAWRVS